MTNSTNHVGLGVSKRILSKKWTKTDNIKEVIRLLRINSDSLAQYVQKADESGAVSLEDIKELQSQQEEIWEAVRGILERLGNIA